MRQKIFQKLIEAFRFIFVVLLITGFVFSGWLPIWLPVEDPSGVWQLKQTRQARVAFADTAGPNGAGTDATGTTTCTDNMAWPAPSSPSLLQSNDTSYVSYTGANWDATNPTDELRVSNFGFSTSGTITGIQVEVITWTPAGGGTWRDAILFTAPGTPVGDDKSDGSTLGTTDPGTTYKSFGGSTDTWNASLTSTQVNASTFGISLCWTATAANSTINVDHVRITITYTPGNPTFTQTAYRWYVDNDAADPTAVWGTPDLAENTAITPLPPGKDPPNNTQELRLRVNITVNTANLAVSSQQFELEFKAGTDGSCTSGSWTDVGAVAASAWQFATSGVTDGADITAVLSTTTSGKGEEYAKTNPTQTNHVAANSGEVIEYDFHIIGSGSDFTSNTQYSFRVTESDETVFDAYTNCPTLTTEPGTESLMRHGNFFLNQIEQGFFWAD